MDRVKSAWNKGLTKETDERVARYAKANSVSQMGHIPWNKNKQGVYSRETLSKIAQTLMGRHHTEATRQKMSLMRKGKSHSSEWSRKIGLAQKGKYVSIDMRERMRLSHLGVALGESHKNSIGRATRRRWRNPGYKDKTLKAQMLGRVIKPNKLEQLLQSLLNELYPDQWEYTGDGKLIIGGRNPDFWNGDHRLIELYGDYWHRGEDPQDKIDLFKQHGYKCLVIWEKELKQPQEVVLEKIRRFSDG